MSGPVSHRDVTRFGHISLAAGLSGVVLGGCLFYLRLTPVGVSADQAAEQAGIVLAIALVFALLLGGVLVALRSRVAWPIGMASGGAAYLVAAVVLTQISVQNAQDHASLLELKGILAKVLQQEPIQAQQYPPAQYGRLGAMLTAFSQDASALQQASDAAKTRLTQIGFPLFSSVETYTDPVARAKAHAQLAELQQLDDAQRQSVHAFVSKARADIDASALSDSDKQEILESFDSSAARQVPAMDAYFDTSRQFLVAEARVLDIADRDRPWMYGDKAVFHSDAQLADMNAALAQVAALQAKATQQREALLEQARSTAEAID